MENIDYSWDKEKDSKESLLDIPTQSNTSHHEADDLKTRFDMQIMRRVFHMFNGSVVATLYLISFSHSQMVHFLGTFACVLYLAEQIRLNYPETAAKLLPFTRFIMRAEEQLKESAMVPYAMAVLLTIITFPKEIAIVGIYSLAFADPLSAIIGIRFGKHKISEHRSYEGSFAFFVSISIVSFLVLNFYYPAETVLSFIASLLLGLICTLFDLIPLKLDDNLTIPLFTSACLWLLLTLFGMI